MGACVQVSFSFDVLTTSLWRVFWFAQCARNDAKYLLALSDIGPLAFCPAHARARRNDPLVLGFASSGVCCNFSLSCVCGMRSMTEIFGFLFCFRLQSILQAVVVVAAVAA